MTEIWIVYQDSYDETIVLSAFTSEEAALQRVEDMAWDYLYIEKLQVTE